VGLFVLGAFDIFLLIIQLFVVASAVASGRNEQLDIVPVYVAPILLQFPNVAAFCVLYCSRLSVGGRKVSCVTRLGTTILFFMCVLV
jgi:hypothetical protein